MKGQNSADNKKNNKNIVFSLLVTHAPLSRVELVRLTGLSKMTITNIITEMINENLVFERDDSSAVCVAGRPPKQLSIIPKSRLIIGVYITYNFIQTCLSDLCGTIYKSMKTPLDFHETSETFQKKVQIAIKEIIPTDDLSKLVGIGVASVGIVHHKSGSIIEAVNFHGIHQAPVSEWIRQVLPKPVFLDTDTNVSALGEMYFGYANDMKNFIYVGVADGIGAGIITQSRLNIGNHGYAGEFGHVSVDIHGPQCSCGNRGCLEMLASTSQISKLAQDILSIGGTETALTSGNVSFEAIVSLAQNGDPLCVGLLRKMCFFIATGLVNLINLLDPEAIFLGHDFVLTGETGLDMIKEFIKSRYITSSIKEVEIRMTALSDASPLIGSVALVIDKIAHNLLPL